MAKDQLVLYGIPNCDSCRKARKWLEAQEIEYRFHDVREDGIERTTLRRWAETIEWQRLLNTRSTTWRSLPDADKSNPSRDKAINLILQHPTLLKRPVTESADAVFVGFSDALFAERLGS